MGDHVANAHAICTEGYFGWTDTSIIGQKFSAIFIQ